MYWKSRSAILWIATHTAIWFAILHPGNTETDFDDTTFAPSKTELGKSCQCSPQLKLNILNVT